MLWNAVSPILRRELTSEVAEPDLALAGSSSLVQDVGAKAHAEREPVHNPLDREALKEFLTTTILSIDEIHSGVSLSGAGFINSCLAASKATDHTHGFSLNELGQHFDGTPNSSAARNIVNALEHCVEIGVLIQNIQNTMEPPRYVVSSEIQPRDLNTQQWLSLTAESKTFLSLALNTVPEIAEVEPPFIELSVQDYLKLRAKGNSMTDLVKTTLIDPAAIYYGSPAYLLEQIETRAEALGLIRASQADPRYIEVNPEV